MTLFILGIPLGVSFRQLVISKTVEVNVRRLIEDSGLIEADVSIDSLIIVRRSDSIDIELDIQSSTETISQHNIEQMRDLLSQQLHRRVSLRVNVIPVRRFNI